jgi:hypothetical protein
VGLKSPAEDIGHTSGADRKSAAPAPGSDDLARGHGSEPLVRPGRARYRDAVADPRPTPLRKWQHPWLRVELLLRALLTTRWDGTTWPRVRPLIPKALAERDRIRRSALFN